MISSTHDPLTEHETVIAYWITRGLNNWEISITVNSTEFMVKKWVTHILDKLGLYNRTLISLWFIRKTVTHFTKEDSMATAGSRMTDVPKATAVQIEISRTDNIVWINVDGECLLRVQNAGIVLVNDQLFSNVRKVK